MLRRCSLILNSTFSFFKSDSIKKPASSFPSASALPVVADDPHAVCRIEDSPFYVFRASAQGLISVVERLLNADSRRLTAKDTKGWTCLHHAAGRAQIKVIDLLLSRGCDINARNNDGDTPLHLAAEKDKVNVVEHLLISGADGGILNVRKLTPIHTAVVNNSVDAIKKMAEFPDRVDINMGGPNDSTALHLAASLDLPDVCSVLMENGGCISTPCCYGLYPVHIAAKNAASKALDRMLMVGRSLGYTSEEMLDVCDNENNRPLHSAVNSGDLDTVQVCLDHGARIDIKQNDLATAFHLAASQGTFEIVKAMLFSHKSVAGDDFCEVLFARDVLNMTPLHRAAMFDHPEVVRFLLEEGSDANALDNELRSPLLLAAIRSGLSSIRILLENQATLATRDNDKRNVLHFLVMYSKSLLVDKEMQDICDIALSKGCKADLLNQKDINGCTPLHLASKQGNLSLTESLIKLGAKINDKNNEEQSPLHFSARYGRVNTARQLLSSAMGPNMINDTDKAGLTALHISSQNGQSDVVQLLLHKGALLHKDFQGRTPLHLAAGGEHLSTIRLLLSFHANLLDKKDIIGNTALHYASMSNCPSAVELLLSYNCVHEDNNSGRSPLDIAIENRLTDVAAVMINDDRWHDLLAHPSSLYGSPMMGLIQCLPKMHTLVLNRCRQVPNGVDPSSTDYYEKFDFSFMQVGKHEMLQWRRSLDFNTSQESWKPLITLNTMVKYGRVDLLSHPVCLQFISMKWHAYGQWFYCINLFNYLLFIATLTGLVMCLNPRNSIIPLSKEEEISEMDKQQIKTWDTIQETGHWIFTMQMYIIIYVVVCLFEEALELYKQVASVN